MKKLIIYLSILLFMPIMAHSQRLTLTQVKNLWNPRVFPSSTNIDSTFNAIWALSGGGLSGIPGYYAKYNASTSLTDALLYDSGRSVILPNSRFLASVDTTESRLTFGAAGNSAALYSGYSKPQGSSLFLNNTSSLLISSSDFTTSSAYLTLDTSTVNIGVDYGSNRALITIDTLRTNIAHDLDVRLIAAQDILNVSGRSISNTATADYTVTTGDDYLISVTDSIDFTIGGNARKVVSGSYNYTIGGAVHGVITDSSSYTYGDDFTLSARNITHDLGVGTFNVSVSGSDKMIIRNNGIPNFSAIPAYADNTAALAGGLVAGDLYYTDTAGEYIIKVAH